MSEYQYYEFQSIDRPLTEQEMRELRAYSTRATIAQATDRSARLRQEHARKPTLLKRFSAAGLLAE